MPIHLSSMFLDELSHATVKAVVHVPTLLRSPFSSIYGPSLFPVAHMARHMAKRIFGPVPSRRLGLSLGVNNIPPKICSYSCVYCQVGRTITISVERRPFYDPREIAREVGEAARRIEFDYVTFVPDGEPTLDSNLGLEARLARDESRRPVAVITNSSLVWLEDVYRDLLEFDYVSVKLDAVSDEVWRRLNRPHPDLKLDAILDSLVRLAKEHRGKLMTETMLVDRMNTDGEELEGIANVLAEIRPEKAYIATPIRPPAERWVRPPDEGKLVEAYGYFSARLGEDKVELLNVPEPPDFVVLGEPEDYVLRTTMVHPLRIEYARRIMPERDLYKLVDEGLLAAVEYDGDTFIVRRLKGRR